MADKTHHYRVDVEWTGNRGTGTSGYRDYDRDHVIRANGKTPIEGSSDPQFRGDRTRWNPEELLVASLSACHKLWYLHLCADAGICVLEYADDAEGIMVEGSGAARFTEVVLHPQVTVRAEDDLGLAERLHRTPHERCFIANSVNFPVRCKPQFVRAAPGQEQHERAISQSAITPAG